MGRGPGTHCLRMCVISPSFWGFVKLRIFTVDEVRILFVYVHFFSLMALSMSDSQFATAVSYAVSKVGKTGIVLKLEQLVKTFS